MVAVATGRFAPSPTATLHLGNLRTALAAWLFARSAGSSFVLRVEDLDPEKSRPEVAAGQLEDIRAVGLEWDGPVVWQSERRDSHEAAIDQLTTAGVTYPCYCSRREVRDAAQAPHGELPEGAYPGTCRELSSTERSERERAGRPSALRLAASDARIEFVDRIAGPQLGRSDDFVLRRADGTPSYNLAVVVDDAAAGVEEVVRGDDLLDSTPRQIHLAHHLDLDVPSYAHVPLVVGGDGERLAKRHKRHTATTLGDRLASGASIHEVRSLLAASLGLEPDVARAGPPAWVQAFDPTRVPRHPWTLSGS